MSLVSYIGEYAQVPTRRKGSDHFILIPDELYRTFRRRSKISQLCAAPYELYQSPCIVCWDDQMDQKYFESPGHRKVYLPIVEQREIKLPRQLADKLGLSSTAFVASDKLGQFFTIWKDESRYRRAEPWMRHVSPL